MGINFLKSQNFCLFFTPKLKWDKESVEIWLSLFHFSKNLKLIQSKMNYYIAKMAGVVAWPVVEEITFLIQHLSFCTSWH